MMSNLQFGPSVIDADARISAGIRIGCIRDPPAEQSDRVE
jgi:hypothetical protein